MIKSCCCMPSSQISTRSSKYSSIIMLEIGISRIWELTNTSNTRYTLTHGKILVSFTNLSSCLFNSVLHGKQTRTRHTKGRLAYGWIQKYHTGSKRLLDKTGFYWDGRTGVFSWCVIRWFYFPWNVNLINYSPWSVTVILREFHPWWNFDIRDPWFVVFSVREPCDRPPLYDPLLESYPVTRIHWAKKIKIKKKKQKAKWNLRKLSLKMSSTGGGSPIGF